MLTPEERAEKAINSQGNLNEAIAAEIRAAVEEERKRLEPAALEMKAHWDRWAVAEEEVRAEAYEDVRKWLLSNTQCADTECPHHDVGDCVAAYCRARAAELSGIISERRIDNSVDHKNCAKLNFIGKLDPLPFQWDDDEEVGAPCTHSANWFDRTVSKCSAYCDGRMHTVCRDCGKTLDGCAAEVGK